MPRCTTPVFLVLALSLAATVRAQTAAPAPAGAPGEPTLERRSVSGAAPRATISGAAEPDPWATAYVGMSGRAARLNLAQLDRALEPHRVTYSRLDAADRARLRRAFDDLVPGRRFTVYALNQPQARGIVYLALGPAEWRDCDGRRRRGDRARCAAAVDSMGRDAAAIRDAITSMGRGGRRRPHVEEVAAVRRMNDGAAAMVLGASSCGCPAARTDASALLERTREAVGVVSRSGLPAWMTLGDQRIDRIAQLADGLERTFRRCAIEG
jgi:hypothetical protein